MTHIMELQDGIFRRNVPGDKLEACAGGPGGDLCEVVAQLLLHLHQKFCVLSLLRIPNSIIRNQPLPPPRHTKPAKPPGLPLQKASRSQSDPLQGAPPFLPPSLSAYLCAEGAWDKLEIDHVRQHCSLERSGFRKVGVAGQVGLPRVSLDEANEDARRIHLLVQGALDTASNAPQTGAPPWGNSSQPRCQCLPSPATPPESKT
jgi:hypothetical protein